MIETRAAAIGWRVLGPGAQIAAFRERHRIAPQEVAPAGEIGQAIAGVLAHHVCEHDGIPVYAVGGGQWRHDLAAIHHLERGYAGPSRMHL